MRVKIVKRTLKKAKKTSSDPNIALLCLQETLIDSKLPSPAEILLGHLLQDNLPRKVQGDSTTEDIISRQQVKQAHATEALSQSTH